MYLGIDAFSLRWQGWNAFETLSFAKTHNVGSVLFSERGQLESLDNGYLEEVKSQAQSLQLRLEVGMRSIDRYAASFDTSLGSGEEQLQEMIHASALLGSGVVRCFMGTQADRLGDVHLVEHLAESKRVLRAVAPIAADAGVVIALENHGGVDLLARELLAMMESIDSSSVGVCFDVGNCLYAGEDPGFAVELLGPYVATSGIRDARVWSTAAGAAVQWVPAGQGDVDLGYIARVLRNHMSDIAFNLEIITGRAPRSIDFLNPASDFWMCYPDLPARDFARFLALSHTGRERPLEQLELPTELLKPPDASLDAFQAQQLLHVKESIDWCHRSLPLLDDRSR